MIIRGTSKGTSYYNVSNDEINAHIYLLITKRSVTIMLPCQLCHLYFPKDTDQRSTMSLVGLHYWVGGWGRERVASSDDNCTIVVYKACKYL